MIGQENLLQFKKMWTWLSGYPAHDQRYYLEHVTDLGSEWLNDCPLANNVRDECDGCSELWQSAQGSLCADPNSPVAKYLDADRDNPDFRSHYASQVAVLAMRAMKKYGYN